MWSFDKCICPHCGVHLLFSFIQDGIAVHDTTVRLSQEEIAEIASELGIEIGAIAGGGE